VAVDEIPLPPTFARVMANDEERSWSPDESWRSMDDFNVNKMLDRSVRPATSAKYGCMWDRWVAFASYHGVKVIPPEVRALEIFIADTA
jgi:hypothetical protein